MLSWSLVLVVPQRRRGLHESNMDQVLLVGGVLSFEVVCALILCNLRQAKDPAL